MTNTTEPTPNLPLLRKIRDHIDAHPEEWRQQSFAMSTIRANNDLDWYERYLAQALVDNPDDEQVANFENQIAGLNIILNSACGTAFCIAGHAVNMTEGTTELDNGAIIPNSALESPRHFDWADLGQAALGLTTREATELFQGANDRADIERIMTAIAARAGEEL